MKQKKISPSESHPDLVIEYYDSKTGKTNKFRWRKVACKITEPGTGCSFMRGNELSPDVFEELQKELEEEERRKKHREW